MLPSAATRHTEVLSTHLHTSCKSKEVPEGGRGKVLVRLLGTAARPVNIGCPGLLGTLQCLPPATCGYQYT